MAHSLERQIAAVRSRTRRLLAGYALGWSLAAVVSTLLVLSIGDYLIRFQDHGIRSMCSLALAGVALWAAYRFWWQGFARRLDDLELAQVVERRFPELANRLTSSLEFLRAPEADALAGSAQLRHAVIFETTAVAEPLNFVEVCQPRPARRALLVGGVVTLMALAIAMIWPASALTAVARLARPWGHDAWPRYHHLEFKQPPARLASGQTFEVELLRDAAHRLPDDVKILYRYDNGANAAEDAEPMRWLNGALVARKEGVTRPFWYRAEGGDDDSMPWRFLDVVEPPRLESLSLKVHPPAYTGIGIETVDKSIHAVRGSRVSLSGAASKKLRRAAIRDDSGAEIVLSLHEDGYGFELAADATEPWTIDRNGQHWIELTDIEGLSGAADERWDMRAIADQPPTVSIDQPATNVYVTAQGEVNLRITAKDDLALAEMSLHFSRSDRTDVEDFSIPLYQGPPTAAPVADGSLANGKLGESRTVEYRWQLAELGLKPPAQVTFWAAASDYLPQSGKSTVRRLTVITPQDLEERLAQRQTLIFGELQRVLKLQQDARAQTKSLQIQLDQVGDLTKQDIDHAQSAELNQRQVKRTLTSPAEGIPAQIGEFLSDLTSNRLDSPELERHMQGVLDELNRLGQDNLIPIERELTNLIKAAQADRPAEGGKKPVDAQVAKSLASAGDHQDQVIGSLEKMLAELGQWDNYRRFAREIAEIQREQQEVAKATAETSAKTVGREVKDLDAQQQADLKKLANQQLELSRRLEKTQQQMAEMSKSVQQNDPLSAATISDGLHQATQQAISGQMRRASGQVEKNQLGQAVDQQSKIARDLDELAGILSNRREQELTRLVKQLRSAEDDLSKLRKQQAGLRKKMQAVRDDPSKSPEEKKRELERLTAEQKKLADETARLARRLERLQAEQAGRSTAGAAGKMSSSAGAGEQGESGAAEEQAERAEKDLEDAQQQLAERRRAAEEDLAREQVSRLQDSLQGLQQRQIALIKETQRLENLRAKEGRFSRSQLSTLADTSREQKALEAETRALAEKLALAEVINMALDGAAGHMARAAERLKARETGNFTQSAQEAARNRFAQLLAALDERAKPAEGKQKGEAGGGEGQPGGGNQGGQQSLAELKLLKILQEDLNERYRVAAAADEPAANDNSLVEMAAEQGKLADLALKLAQPTDKAPEDDPEKLPDIRDTESNPVELPPVDIGEPKLQEAPQ